MVTSHVTVIDAFTFISQIMRYMPGVITLWDSVD